MRYKSINNILFKKNRKKLSDNLINDSLAIIHSNDEMPKNGDQFFHFRQNSDLFYLTGIEQPKSILCLCPNHPIPDFREILFIELSTPENEIWFGHQLTKEDAQQISGIKNILWLNDFSHTISDIMRDFHTVFINETEVKKTDFVTRDIRYSERLKGLFTGHSFTNIAPMLEKIRMVKEPEEIELINTACKITGDAFQRMIRIIKPGIMEYEIEAEMLHEFISNGFAFEPIIASGPNACILHYTENNKMCKNGDLVLLDFAADYANYGADCSRTLPVNGHFTKRQREIYKTVLRVMKQATAMLLPGTSINEVHEKSCNMIHEELINLKLYNKKEADEAEKENPSWKKYFMHGISHYLGLDTHDVGKKSAELRPGMIVTCEPGIYIPKEGIGIRLENDILITENGNINLTSHIPIEPDEIEALMNQ